jgi:hypothetical protein
MLAATALKLCRFMARSSEDRTRAMLKLEGHVVGNGSSPCAKRLSQ